jgi:hypothetical protein
MEEEVVATLFTRHKDIHPAGTLTVIPWIFAIVFMVTIVKRIQTEL